MRFQFVRGFGEAEFSPAALYDWLMGRAPSLLLQPKLRTGWCGRRSPRNETHTAGMRSGAHDDHDQLSGVYGLVGLVGPGGGA